MTTLVETLSTVELSTITHHRTSSPNYNVNLKDNKQIVEQLAEPYKLINSIQKNVICNTLTVLILGEKQSSLRTILNRCLTSEDTSLIFFPTREELLDWLNTNSSVKVASLIIEAMIDIQEIVTRSHPFKNIRSILIYCKTNMLITLQRFSRSFIKIDGIFDDVTRLLIKLVIDLALFSEQLGDQKREDENNELEAQKYYDRAFRFCILARTL
ncbi:unnamed protein product [Adineta steineri]|uniref:Uncharacterized protein n=1 Tax=Adineta steineri TaxID=433720 RepID=A0A813NYN6_9BILA|nr:unnamed protein product [Adineta steineri]